MGLLDWSDKADALEVTHKGAPVLSHPDVISSQNSHWEEEQQEEQRGKQAHQALNDLFSAFDDDEDE